MSLLDKISQHRIAPPAVHGGVSAADLIDEAFLSYNGGRLREVCRVFTKKSIPDVIAAAKAAPGKLSFASSGSGSSTHISAELFRLMTGTQLLHIPYKGSGAAMPDLISGRVSMMFENMPGVVGYIKAGKVKVLAVTGAQRTPALPDVKTVAESGVPGYESLSWSGIAAPAGTPPEVVARLNREINTILANPEMKQKLAEQGADAVGGTPEAFLAHIARERQKWSKVVRDAAIVVN